MTTRKKIFLITLIIVLVGIGFLFRQSRQGMETTYSGAEQVATEYIRENSVEGLTYRLEKTFEDKGFVIYEVVPTGAYAETTDTARIVLRRIDSEYEAVAFGTAFPDLVERYPELKGRF